MRFVLIFSIFFSLFTCKGNSKDSKQQEQKNQEFKYKLAYNVLFDSEKDDYEVFIMDLDGQNKENITNLKGVEWCYNAYEDVIYFISDKDTLHRNYYLYKMTPDGSDKTKVCDYRLADSWHGIRKNGSELIIKPHKSVDTAFYIINDQGKLIKKIKPELAFFNDPIFSPNGKQIVFRGGNKSSKFEKGFDDELYIMDDDGANMKQLTHYPENDTLKPWYAYAAGPPRWNSVENFITYQSYQDGKYGLYAVTPDGSKHWKLTENSVSEGWHDWSQEGDLLAIEVFDDNQTQFDIILMNWKTKEITKLTDSTYKYQQAPVFIKTFN